ncbi:deoxynucleoside kinase, partial [Planococcus sp. SIMBA_143]
RIKERGRPMEQQTPTAYWEEMYERYTNWIDSFNACPILRLNINEYDLVNDPSSVELILKRIEQKFQQIPSLNR